MSERIDGEIRKAVCEVAGEPRGEVRERALAGMAAVGPLASGSRLRWVPTILGAGLVIAALGLLPYSAGVPTAGMQSALAAQQAMAAEALEETPDERVERKVTRENLPEGLEGYAERAPAFVRERYPDDPEMLIAAGLLTRDFDEAMALTKAAVEKSGNGAAWAAYAGTLMEAGPQYDRLGISGVDPADSEAVARERRRIAEAGSPTTLSPREAAPVLEVLRQWQEAEPENATPVAFEMYYLYGLHRDRESLERWEEAGRLPEVASHHQTAITGAARLLDRMGMSPWEALSNSYNTGWRIGMISKFRQCARIAVYEGRLALLEDRPEDAVGSWMATIEFGRNMQHSADTLIECLVGIAIEGIGGSPVWVWELDGRAGIPDGPLHGGRLYHGEHHGFFVSEVGEEADAEVRDSMARAKVRSMLSREYVEQVGALPPEQLRSAMLRSSGAWYGALLVACLLVFGGISIRLRNKADEATSLSWAWRGIIAVLALLPVTAGLTLAWLALRTSAMQPGLGVVVFGGIGLSFLAMFLVPLVAALWSRKEGVRLVTAWRGNLRRVLPVGMVVLAALSLGLGIAGKQAEASWSRKWMTETEMDRVVREMGREWEHPTIPPDAWRAEPPPHAGSG